MKLRAWNISFKFNSFFCLHSMCLNMKNNMRRYKWRSLVLGCISAYFLSWFTSYQFSSVQLLGRVRLFVTPWTAACQSSLSITTPGAYSNSYPLSQWCHPTISSSVIPSLPTFNLSQHQHLFKWASSSHQVAEVWEFQLQHQSFQWIFRSDFL